MSEYVLRLRKRDRDFFLLWSTVADAPITPGLPELTFVQYCADRVLGLDEPDGLAAAVERAKRPCRTSDSYEPPMTVEQVIRHNRAGSRERAITLRGLVRRYVKESP